MAFLSKLPLPFSAVEKVKTEEGEDNGEEEEVAAVESSPIIMRLLCGLCGLQAEGLEAHLVLLVLEG